MLRYSLMDKSLGHVMIEFDHLSTLALLKVDVNSIIYDHKKHTEVGYIIYKGNDISEIVLDKGVEMDDNDRIWSSRESNVRFEQLIHKNVWE